jgi:hypothetical protein
MSLVELVEAGDVVGVIRALGELTPAQRKKNDVALAARREAVAVGWRDRPEAERDAQLAAELGCLDSAADAAAWIRVPENGRPLWGTGEDGGWLVDVVNLRPERWRVDLVGALGGQVTTAYTLMFAFLEHLVLDTGCPLPSSDAFLTSWLADRWKDHRKRPPHLRGGVPGVDLGERLLADPWTARLLPMAVTRRGAELPVEQLLETSLVEEGLLGRDHWVDRVFAEASAKMPWGSKLLTTLALSPTEHARVAGTRVETLDRCLERLLEDGTRPELAPWLDFLRVLAPTPAEHAAVARDYLALLDGSPPVVDYAQEVLAGVDEAGLIEPEFVVEAGERVLLRPEKKIVRAQLSWLDKAAKRDPARAGQVVIAAAAVFEHRDSALQERALAVVAKHLKAAGESVLPDLRVAAERLSPAHSARAAELFGTPADATEQVVDVLPAVPEPRSVPGPLATVTEVAQEVAAVLAGDEDVVVFERALDGLVRHAHLDRAALAAALKPTTRKLPRWRHDHMPAELYDVARAVRDEDPRIPDFMTHRSVTLAGEALLARMREAGDAVRTGALPFLLAVPTSATGALDAAELVERLATYEKLGVTPDPVDLAQALLRVTPTTDRRVLAAAGELRSDAGQRVARWLRDGGLPHQDSKPAGWDPYAERGRWKMLRPASPGVVLDPPLPKRIADLVGPYNSSGQSGESPKAFWIAQLPHHRDVVAAREYFASATRDRGATALPFLAESGGPAGYAVHVALAWSTGTDRPQARDSSVDAILVLAARGQLDATLLGQQIGVLVQESLIPANRLVETLHVMVDAGAPGVLWSVLEGALPVLLRGTPARGAGELLAIAVECASSCGATGEIAEVTAVAERKGSSQLVKNARALREVLLRAVGT